MRIAICGASALMVVVLSSLACSPGSASAPPPRDARSLREAPLDTPLRSMLGPRAGVFVAPAPDRPTAHMTVAPDAHTVRRAHR
jgi:hypothetical protein